MAKRKLILILAVALVLLVGTSYVAVTMLLPDTTVEAEPEAEPGTVGEFYMVEGIMVNPAGTKGARFLRVSAALEVMDNGVISELERRDVQIRDILITELSANSIGELMNPTSKEQIRSAIITKINRLLNTGALSNLYYLDYIVQ